MLDPSYEILPQRGQFILSYGDDKYKDKDKEKYKDKDKNRKVPRRMG